MPHLGTQPPVGFKTTTKQSFSGDNSTTAFTLNRASSTATDLEVFVDNIQQEPTTAYSVSGTTLTFTEAPPTGTNNIYVVYQGKSIGETTPGENSIEFGMIKSINGGYENKASVSSTITVDSADNMMLCGPVSFTGTVTVNGTLTVV